MLKILFKRSKILDEIYIINYQINCSDKDCSLKTKRVKLSLKTGLVRENFCGKGWALRQVFNTSMTRINVEMKGQSK